MVVRKGCCGGGCLIKALIAVVIIVVIIGGALWWVSAQTPDRLGFADRDFGGITLRQMGLAEMKIIDIIRVFRSLINPDENAIITNSYDPIVDKAEADAKSNKAGIPMDGDEPDYSYLLKEQPLSTPIPILLEYTDTELAYIMDTIINTPTEYDEDLQVIRDLNGSLRQIEIEKDNEYILGMMLAVDISSIKDDIPMGNTFIPDNVYLNSVNKLEADSNGIIITQSQTIEVNGMTDQTSTAIINALFGIIANEQPEIQEEDPIEFFNNAFGAVFKRVVNNIGYVGDAQLDNNEEVIESSIVYGEEGIDEHVIKVITRKEE